MLDYTDSQIVALNNAYKTKLEREHRREDQLAGRICAMLTNIHRDPKRSRPYKETDFMPQQKQKMNTEELHQAFEHAAKAKQ